MSPDATTNPGERLAGKVVLVTGAASGIGRATVERIAAEGGVAVGADINAGPGDGPEVRPLDVTDEGAVAALVSDVVAEHGRLDGVLTAAGVAGGGPVHLLDREEWDRVIGVNLLGTFLVAKHALAAMVDAEPLGPGSGMAAGQRGSVVTIASIEGLEGTAGGSVYNTSKGGVVLLTKNIAIDYGRRGIRANAICPGFVDTPLTGDVFGMEGMESILERFVDEHALGRMAQPSEIAAMAAFLLSDDASFVSGQAIAVDGGYTAGRDHGLVGMLGLG